MTSTLLTDSFVGPDGFICSETHQAPPGSLWVLTSGSLFRSNNEGWTGKPNTGNPPDSGSTPTGVTDSSIFRMTTAATNFGNVDISLFLRVDAFVSDSQTPAVPWDGAHIWVRHQSPFQLYAVSVCRRDGTMIIKKKIKGGPDPSAGGTYYDLSPSVGPAPVVLGKWMHVVVSVRDLADGSVSITAVRDGYKVSAVDKGTGAPPLRGSAAFGIRGDNVELRFASVGVQG